MKRRVVFLAYVVSLFLSSKAGIAATIPSIPTQDQYLLPSPVSPIYVSIIPNELRCQISMRSGTYEMNEPLQLQVTSSAPGCYVQIQTTDLKGKEDEIGSEEIYIVTKQATTSLKQPQTIIEDGQTGETSLEVFLELQTTRRHKPGTYTGQLSVITGYLQGPPPQIFTVIIEVEVTCQISGSISGNQMYFHYGIPNDILNSTANGQIIADTDVCLSLSVLNGRIDCLPMLKSVTKQDHNEGSYIPLIWQLRDNGSGWREPSGKSFNSSEIFWELSGDSKEIIYELQCSPRPDTTQTPGNYGMSVVMTVMPIL